MAVSNSDVMEAPHIICACLPSDEKRCAKTPNHPCQFRKMLSALPRAEVVEVRHFPNSDRCFPFSDNDRIAELEKRIARLESLVLPIGGK